MSYKSLLIAPEPPSLQEQARLRLEWDRARREFHGLVGGHDEISSELPEPRSFAETRKLRQEIIAKKNAEYPGGYQGWCADRGIPKERR